MMRFYAFSFLIIIKIPVFALCVQADGESNVTTEKIPGSTISDVVSNCSEYLCENGYNYVTFFRVKPAIHRKPNIKLELHFSIKGPRDGHILMSSTAFPKMNESVYELVVGAGGNTYSELRRMRKKFGIVSVNTKDILSPHVYNAFYIRVNNDGLIEFGKKGEDLALIGYKDPMPLDINYFSFASWTGVVLKFLYDCNLPQNTSITGDELSEAVQDNTTALSTERRLRNHLLKNKTLTSIPLFATSKRQLVKVVFQLKIRSLSYDVEASKLTTHGHLTIVWGDERLRWDFINYKVKRIFFKQNEIWEPELELFNSVEVDALDPSKTKSYALASDLHGVVTRLHSIHVKTLCSPSQDLVHWPRDVHRCVLDIGLRLHSDLVDFREFNEIVFDEVDIMDFQWMPPLDDRSLHISSEWDVLQVSRSTISSSYYYPSAWNASQTQDDKRRNIFRNEITIQRRSHTYSLLYFTPFVSIVVIVLFTFCMPVSHTTKMVILGISLVFVTICLSEIMYKMPSFMVTIPNIVKFYLAASISIFISLIINGIFIKLTIEPKPMPFLNSKLKRLLKSPMANMLGIVAQKVDDTYEIMSPDDATVQEESQADASQENEDMYWNLLLTAIERFMFFGLIFVFLVLFCVHY